MKINLYITLGAIFFFGISVSAQTLSFSADTTFGEVPLSVNFNADISQAETFGTDTYTIQFFDGENYLFSIYEANNLEREYTFESIGDYNIKAKLIRYYSTYKDTLAFTDSIAVQVYSMPVANFTVASDSGQVPFEVSFENLSNGNLTGYEWLLGDAGISTEENPVHIFSEVGLYDISLIASNPLGVDTLTRTGYIKAAPVVSFSYELDTLQTPHLTRFIMPDSLIAVIDSCRWEFGIVDSTSTEYFPTYAYPNGQYTVKLIVYTPGCKVTKEIVIVLSDKEIVGVDELKNLPQSYSLMQNYPNPFNPNTIINYHLSEAGNVNLKVFNTLGKEILILVDSYKDAGTYSFTFNAGSLSSGVYFYRLEVNSFAITKKMILMK